MKIVDITEGRMKDLSLSLEELATAGSSKVTAFPTSNILLVNPYEVHKPLKFRFNDQDNWRKAVLSVGRHALRAGWADFPACLRKLETGPYLSQRGVNRVLKAKWSSVEPV